jgi:uncharacterized protein (TIGR02680 family)
MEKTVEKWTMYRAVLFNYWYYPDQEFYFSNGCGVLRGHNGSGKSVTTQSLITVLLDGDVRSHKLDPFGGRERKITDTVLGEKGLVDIDHRIGYIALEFKKGNSNVYKTIGMGIEADRNKKQPKVWYFIIDGKRIGEKERDLRLFITEIDEGKEKKIPLNEKDLRISIEAKLQCGKVYSNRDEYADNVNKHLFGFESLESYKDLIGLLLQARSPKLSDQNKPEGVVDVLNDSLPQLTGEELRPLTSSIEAIDRIEKDLIAYKRDLKGVKSLNDTYEEYNKITLTEKAMAYLKSTKDYEETKRKILESKKNIDKYQKKLSELKSESTRLESELTIYRTEKANLGVDEIEAVQQNKEDEEKILQDTKVKLEELEIKRDSAEIDYRKYKAEYEEQESKRENFEKELKGYMGELNNLSSELFFEQHERFYNHFFQVSDNKSYTFNSWKQALSDYEIFISNMKGKLEEYERLKKDVSMLDDQLGNIRMEIDKVQSNIEKEEGLHEEEVIRLTHEIANWVQDSKQLAPAEFAVDELQRNLEDVFDTLEKDEYFRALKNHYETRQRYLEKQRMEKEFALGLLEDKLNRIDEEIQSWKDRKEIEPEFVKRKGEDWKKLHQQNISFYPFYEVFEFEETVSEEEQIAIQSVLYEAGILTSVLVSREDIQKASEFSTVLLYHSEKELNLGKVLRAADGFEQFNDLLRGIAFQKDENGYLLSSGYYKNSFVEGRASIFDENIYIGKASREVVRQKKIQGLEQEYIEKMIEKEETEQSVRDVKDIGRVVSEEYNSFPSLRLLEDSIKKIKTARGRIRDILEPEETSISDKMSGISIVMKRMMSDIKKQMDFSELPLTLNSFTDELRNIGDYSKCLGDIEVSYKDRNSAEELAKTKLHLVNVKEEDADYYHSEVLDVEGKVQASMKKIKSFNKRLQDLGSEDILNRVEELSRKVNVTIPKRQQELIREEEQIKGKAQDSEDSIRVNETYKLPFQQKIKESWEGAFGEHVKLGFIGFEEEMSLLEKAEIINKEMGHLMDKKRDNIDKTKARLNRVFKDQSIELPMHYDIDMTPEKSDYFPTIEADGENQTLLNLMSDQMTRYIISLEVENRRVSPSNAVKLLEERIEELEVNAAEKDRELYQDILINTLGESIRRKINYVERWENEMNKFMEHENLIKFRIKWVPKKIEEDKKEEELDTRKLVDALKKDSRWIDIDEISRHFRSKIKEAKRRFEKDEEVNLQQVMREVLDYRTWFDFEIYFTKKGDTERRLNRKSYGELSGGQRVLAMVTPVLAALYAKYLEGREDAPKLFTLDEAFSRVDEENINVMFNYIYKLGFNYILNSQSLWGCFESVPSLSIYELSRPENRPSVTVLPYYWNGNRRRRVEEATLKALIEGKDEVVANVSAT